MIHYEYITNTPYKYKGELMKEIKGKIDFREMDKEIKEFWENNEIYQKVKKLNENYPEYYFVDGPPYCSGSIHLGTAWNKIIKDTVLRFKRMQNYNVLDKAGWDMHGLPIEVKVEHEFNLQSKKDIETKVGTDVFIEKCKEFALNNKVVMELQFKNLGIWLDWENAYLPIKNDYIEAGWWSLKRAHEKELLSKDLRVGYWCPRCETSLAEHEVRGEYKDVLDPSAYVKFKVADDTSYPNTYFVIWTTTPWTLISNLLIAVNPEFDYGFVEVIFDNDDKETWVIAEALVEDVIKIAKKQNNIKSYNIVKKVKGKELEGIKYIPALLEENERQKEFFQLEQAHTIVLGDHVSLDGGTGLVHTAPGFGEEDFEVGKKYNSPIYSPIDDEGKYIEGKWKGIFVKDADDKIIATLTDKNLIVNVGKKKHTYPHCWRCKTPLLFRSTEQWFLNISKIKNNIVEHAKNTDWVPNWVETRYINGVKFVGDWNISRQRYWGIPLPIWICENKDCGKYKIIGSIEELKKEMINDISINDDLHKPTVDKIIMKCDCGCEMKRTPDVLDVWYDSGLAPYASINAKELKKADFIVEGNDQVTKWFYSQHALSEIVFDDIPYKKCMMHGFTLDETGEKMSKSIGNVVNPDDVVEEFGADLLRFYLLSANKAWEDLRFSISEMNDVKSVFNTLWNSYSFAVNYMVLDDFSPNEEYFNHLRDEDKWIISKINSLTKEAIEVLEIPHLHEYTWKVRDFILNDLSRWYIKLIRNRTWMEKEDPDKLSAYQTLYYVLMKLVVILAPVAPHISEKIYQNLKIEGMPQSIFMTKIVVEEEYINKEVEEGIETAREIVDAILKGRDKVKYTLRYPISKIILPNELGDIVDKYHYIIKEQGNVKNIEVKEFEGNITVKPNFRTLGASFKSDVPAVVKIINSQNPKELKEKLAEGEITIDGFTIKPEHVEFKIDIPDNIVGMELHKGSVYIDIELTDEIIKDGLKREVIRRIQSMRKDMDLDIEEKIKVKMEGIEFNEEGLKSIEKEVRGTFGEFECDNIQEWSIKTPNGEVYNLKIGIKKNM